jgi:hypothetical protein
MTFYCWAPEPGNPPEREKGWKCCLRDLSEELLWFNSFYFQGVP